MDYTNHSVVYKNHDMIYTDHDVVYRIDTVTRYFLCNSLILYIYPLLIYRLNIGEGRPARHPVIIVRYVDQSHVFPILIGA